jgi:general secretion pathway protein N
VASSKLSLIALGAGAYVAFALTTFPASVAARWFAPQTLGLAGVQGTVWRGSAAYGSFSGYTFSDVRWQLQPTALLTGRLSLSLDARLGDGFVRTGMTVAGSRVGFSELRAALDVALVSPMLPAEASGNASVELETLELEDGWPVQASGTVRVANLTSAPWIPVPGVTNFRVGNFLARVSTTDDQVVALLSDEGGPIELDGTARLMPERRYRLEARIKPRPDASDVLVQGLKFMTPVDSSGYYPVERAGQL